MSRWNCYTYSGIVQGVYEGCTLSIVCYGPCSATFVCSCYARYYLLINQLVNMEFLN